MLTEEQIQEIRGHLERAQNPVFFYDADADGLASFLLLARWIGKGKGIIAKNPKESSEAFLKKVQELGADSVFVLDSPQIQEKFVKGVEEMNLPLIIIDHHNVPKIETEFYYNTFHVSGKNEPVSYICYKITEQKKDMWIAAVGCVSDYFIPDFFKEFEEKYPELVDCEYKDPFDLTYKSRLGKLVKVFNYGLKDTTTNIIKMSNFLLKAEFPSQVLEENSKTHSFLQKYESIDNTINKLVKKAEKEIEGNFLFFTYGGDTSLSQHLSNQLMYLHPELMIVVGYRTGGIVKFSLRWFKDVRTLTLKAIKEIPGASGGGHEHATGAQMSEIYVEKFKENILSLLK